MRGITLIFEHPLDSRRTRLRSLYFLARAVLFLLDFGDWIVGRHHHSGAGAVPRCFRPSSGHPDVSSAGRSAAEPFFVWRLL